MLTQGGRTKERAGDIDKACSKQAVASKQRRERSERWQVVGVGPHDRPRNADRVLRDRSPQGPEHSHCHCPTRQGVGEIVVAAEHRASRHGHSGGEHHQHDDGGRADNEQGRY